MFPLGGRKTYVDPDVCMVFLFSFPWVGGGVGVGAGAGSGPGVGGNLFGPEGLVLVLSCLTLTYIT